MVVRYDFLWWAERQAGQENARKNRPAVVVLVATTEEELIRVMVAPVTTVPPSPEEQGVEIPKKVQEHIGLDSGKPCWVLPTEINRFIWPGFDLQPLPGETGAYVYGYLPDDIFGPLKERILERARDKSLKSVNRTD